MSEYQSRHHAQPGRDEPERAAARQVRPARLPRAARHHRGTSRALHRTGARGGGDRGDQPDREPVRVGPVRLDAYVRRAQCSPRSADGQARGQTSRSPRGETDGRDLALEARSRCRRRQPDPGVVRHPHRAEALAAPRVLPGAVPRAVRRVRGVEGSRDQRDHGAGEVRARDDQGRRGRHRGDDRSCGRVGRHGRAAGRRQPWASPRCSPTAIPTVHRRSRHAWATPCRPPT